MRCAWFVINFANLDVSIIVGCVVVTLCMRKFDSRFRKGTWESCFNSAMYTHGVPFVFQPWATGSNFPILVFTQRPCATCCQKMRCPQLITWAIQSSSEWIGSEWWRSDGGHYYVVSDAFEKKRPRSGARTSSSAPKRVLGLWNLFTGVSIEKHIREDHSRRRLVKIDLACNVSVSFQQLFWKMVRANMISGDAIEIVDDNYTMQWISHVIFVRMDGVRASESAPPPAAAPARHAPPPAAVSLADYSEMIQLMGNDGKLWRGEPVFTMLLLLKENPQSFMETWCFFFPFA